MPLARLGSILPCDRAGYAHGVKFVAGNREHHERLVPEHDPVHKVSIIPRGRALGVTSCRSAAASAEV